ncbi:MAG: queuosine precursor transporter [Saprospiraceae bacterium]|nr:queuosine precursor transporter [Saprospiraceae bacterium]
MSSVLESKATRLFLMLGGFFIANALIAEFIGVKIFSLEETLGWEKVEFNLFGRPGSLVFTAGVLLWPVVFVMTDVINEYFGQKGVRFLSYLAVALIAYAFFMVFNAIRLEPADWWVTQYADNGVPDMQAAFSNIFGQGNWIIIGSLVAFLLGQIIDVLVFHRIKKITGEKHIWLRATGSTLISQFIDSFVVLYIAFVLGPAKWSFDLFLNVGIVNYIYKFIMAVALTPLIYLAHYIIDKYLGVTLSTKLRMEAMDAN